MNFYFCSSPFVPTRTIRAQGPSQAALQYVECNACCSGVITVTRPGLDDKWVFSVRVEMKPSITLKLDRERSTSI